MRKLIVRIENKHHSTSNTHIEESADSTLLEAIYKAMRQMPAVKEKTIQLSLRKNCIKLQYEDIPYYLLQDVSTLRDRNN